MTFSLKEEKLEQITVRSELKSEFRFFFSRYFIDLEQWLTMRMDWYGNNSIFFCLSCSLLFRCSQITNSYIHVHAYSFFDICFSYRFHSHVLVPFNLNKTFVLLLLLFCYSFISFESESSPHEKGFFFYFSVVFNSIYFSFFFTNCNVETSREKKSQFNERQKKTKFWNKSLKCVDLCVVVIHRIFRLSFVLITIDHFYLTVATTTTRKEEANR